MAKYKAYPKYKDSGVEWLGMVPESWGVSRLKHVASIYGRIGFRGYTVDDIVGEGEGAIVLSPSNIVDEKFSLEKKTFLRWGKYFESPEIIVTENDILLVKTGSTYGKSTIIKILNEPMTINPQMALIKEVVVEPRFLAYWFNASLIKAKIEIANTGSGMPTMTQENINNFPVLIPHIKQDVLIADFLDHETAKIDNLIEKQKQLIELLKEKRQAVISHAVTKGINPDVPMKDSGVEWLGEVPEHWDIPKLLHVTRTIGDGLHSTPEYDNETGYYFINGNNLVNGKISIGVTAKEVSKSEYNKHYVHLDEASVLLSINGTIGNVAVYNNERIILGKSAAYVKCGDKLNVNYLMYCFITDEARYYFDLEVTGTTIFNLSLNSIRQMKVCIPPLEEQKLIIDYCFAQENKYNYLIHSADTAIKLMQERRTALISAAVTGKIDVRNWVAPEAKKAEVSQEATA